VRVTPVRFCHRGYPASTEPHVSSTPSTPRSSGEEISGEEICPLFPKEEPWLGIPRDLDRETLDDGRLEILPTLESKPSSVAGSFADAALAPHPFLNSRAFGAEG
jgi:hypothetical protein